MTQEPSMFGSSNLKVIMVCPHWPNIRGGGMGSAVTYLVRAWEDQTDAPALQIVQSRGPVSLLRSPPYLLRAVAITIWECARRRVNVLHVNIATKGSTVRKAVFVFVALVLGVPYILHLHAGTYHLFFRKLPRPLKAVVRAMFCRATRVIVLGTKWRDFVCDEIGVDSGRVVILHNAVSVPTSFEREHSNGPCEILFLGRLEEEKGVPELLRAFATERVRSLEWTAILAGHGDVEYYKKMAADLRLDERIDFPGWVEWEMVSTYLKSADVLVLPSHNEGLPMSLLEGMAHGLAVVATPVGAIPETIEDGTSGLLVPPGDICALADALVQVIRDAELRRSLSQAARKIVSERFDIRLYAQRMATLYRQCATGSK